MKKQIIILFILLNSFSVFAQIDSVLLSLENYQKIELENGMKIILVQTNRYDYLNYRLIIDYQPFLEKDNKGANRIVAHILGCETNEKNRVWKTMVSHDNGADSLFNFLSDLIVSPNFKRTTVDNVKKYYISQIALNNSLDSVILDFSNVFNFGKNHPYCEKYTKKTINNIDNSILFDTYNKIFTPENTYLIIVGNIKVDTINFLAQKYFGKWQKKNISKNNYSITNVTDTKVFFINNNTSNTYVSITYPIDNNLSHADYIASRVMFNVLRANIDKELNNNGTNILSIKSKFCPDPFIGDISISASQSDNMLTSTVFGILSQMKKIQSIDENKFLVKNTKAKMKQDFINSFKRPQNIDKYELTKNYYSNYLSNLNKVSPYAVQQTARKYIIPEASNIVIIGNRNKLFCQLIELANYYDVYFNDMELNNNKIIRKGFGSQVIINDYISYCKAENKIIDVVINFDAEYKIDTISYQLKGQIKKKHPHYYFYRTELFLQTDTLFHHLQICNDEAWLDSNIIEQKIFLEEDFYKRIYKAYLFPELFFEQLNFEHKLICDTSLINQGLYKIEIITPYDVIYYDYYNIDTKEKVKTEKLINKDNNLVVTETYEYSDYREIDEQSKIKLPFLIKQNFKSISIEMKITNIDTKINLKKKDFDIDVNK